ncbi:hypothetical protein ACQPZJ_26990 [Actinoplanes sp. CA-054009]
MDVRRLVFDVGDRVTGWGQMVADADGVWLDLARFVWLSLAAEGSRPRSRQSVRLVGADAVRAAALPDIDLEWPVNVSGVWLGEAIEVESLSQAGSAPARVDREWATPPCPPPAGGWPRGERDENLDFDRLALEDSGVVVAAVTFRPSPYQAVLVVAADDIDAVEKVLRPQLPGRFCVVASRWTRGRLDDVRAHLMRHWQDWTLESVGEDVDEQAQACVEVELLRVTGDLARWAATLPDDLLRLEPSLVPLT